MQLNYSRQQWDDIKTAAGLVGAFPLDGLYNDGSGTPKGYRLISHMMMNGSCPMTVRKLCEASFSANYLPNDERNVRSKLFMAVTVGVLPTALIRLVRCIVRTAAFPLRLPYLAYKADKYDLNAARQNPENANRCSEIDRECARVANEWEDLAETIQCWACSVVCMVRPTAYKAHIDSIRNKYITRIADDILDDIYIAKKISYYEGNHCIAVAARRRDEHPAIKKDTTEIPNIRKSFPNYTNEKNSERI